MGGWGAAKSEIEVPSAENTELKGSPFKTWSRSEYVTVSEKTWYKLKIAILDNAFLKVQTLCYFMLKSDLPNGDKITSVWQCKFVFCMLFFSLNTYQIC